MAVRGPVNRRRKITGKADASSMQTHGEGLQQGPVGQADGYKDRKEQQAQRPSATGGQRPKADWGAVGGQSQRPSGGLFGLGGQQGQQDQRPSGGPFGLGGQQGQQPQQPQQPQQAQQAQRPAQAQRPQQGQQAAGEDDGKGLLGSALGGMLGGGAASGGGSGSGKKSGCSPILIIILVVVLLGGGGGLSGLFGNLFGGGSNNTGSDAGIDSLLGGGTSNGLGSIVDTAGSLLGGNGLGSLLSGSGSTLGGSVPSTGLLSGYSQPDLSSLLGGSWYGDVNGFGTASATTTAASQRQLDRTRAAGSRANYTRYTENDPNTTFTIMVYMCGADLESRSGMATKDLQEMLSASRNFGDNLRLIVYTGGSKRWQNSVVSSSVNQIYRVRGGKLERLSDNDGTGAMTNPATLSSFISRAVTSYPAQRYALILWDHGSGSVAGYGYDEKNPGSGSMSLAGLNTALRDGGVKFDFIGFDTCLMATVENALMCSRYADYLIASEETEPGIGWYYTQWLTALGKNTGMNTLDIGKTICDDFVSACSTQCRGQQTTLSLIDLAELEHTVPEKLTAFSQSVSGMIKNQEYATVSKARSGSREFAQSSRIDQVDLADLCDRLGTSQSKALAKTLRAAVKYNNYNNISNANGLSVYFPYQKAGNVNKAAQNYDAIGMDDSYTECIRAFAQVAQSGQAVTGGGANFGLSSLFGSSDYGASSSGDMLGDLLGAFLGRSGASQEDKAVIEQTLQNNLLDANSLVFKQDGEDWVLEMTPEQWALVTDVTENLFYDNGEGYVDLGLDARYAILFDDQGRLVADMEGAWVAIGDQPVAYYIEDVEALDGGFIITGRVPALLSGTRTTLLDGEQTEVSFADERVELIVVTALGSDEDDEYSYIAGARPVYVNGETDTVSKALEALQDGDVIQPIADLYDYEQNFQDAYRLGNPITVKGTVEVTSTMLPDPEKAFVTYRFTDIYNQEYWTDVVGK